MGRRLWAVAVLAISVLPFSCSGGKSGAALGGKGGIITVGMRDDFQPINPITAGDQYTVQLINYGLFTPLVQYDAKLNVQPWLAQSWELSDTAVTFHLRHDVRWHDGQPVTAEDVKFTFDMAKDPATASLIGSAYVPNVKSAAVVDSYTVHFSFVQPHAQALEDFWWAPAPKHLLRNVSATGMRDAPYNRKPIGSGPFKFSEWNAAQRLVIERNPGFPPGLGGASAADRVVFRIIPEPSTMLTELVTGGIQVDVPVAPAQIREIKSTRSINFISYPGTTVYYLGWNDAREPFTSPNVRRALGMAINRKEIIAALLFGQGTPATSTVPPWHPLYPKDIAPVAYDPNGAAQLLDAEGWKRNGNGVRQKAGKPLRFTLLTSQNPLNASVVEIMQSQLKKIGADVQVRELEFQTVLAQHKSRNFDAVFANWVLDNFQMASAPAALFSSKLISVPKSTNRSSVNIPQLDRLIAQAQAATTLEQARPIWRQMTQLLEQQQPITFVFWLNELAATRKEVGNVVMDPRGELFNMSRWTISGR